MNGAACEMHTRSTYWMNANVMAKTMTQYRARLGMAAGGLLPVEEDVASARLSTAMYLCTSKPQMPAIYDLRFAIYEVSGPI